MSKKVKDLAEKIVKTRHKLIQACLDHDEERMIKLQHKLLKLNLKGNKC